MMQDWCGDHSATGSKLQTSTYYMAAAKGTNARAEFNSLCGCRREKFTRFQGLCNHAAIEVYCFGSK